MEETRSEGPRRALTVQLSAKVAGVRICTKYLFFAAAHSTDWAGRSGPGAVWRWTPGARDLNHFSNLPPQNSTSLPERVSTPSRGRRSWVSPGRLPIQPDWRR